MAEIIPFSQALRERTWGSHGDSESAGFMDDLMAGRGTKEDYIALVVQHWYIYKAIEDAAVKFENDPMVAPFISPKLTRIPAIEADLEFLLGENWRESVSALPTTVRYADRITEVAEDWAGGFIAHHYTRYLGDLSGGQMIRKLMQRQFGFDTNGVGFYIFDEITEPKEFKETYREQLDAVEWTLEERDRVIDEVIAAYRFNTELFVDLATAKAQAAA